MSKKPIKKEKAEVQTTGHSWDGIEEFNNPLPRWWLWVFYACVVWALAYTIWYPAWPLINGATTGLGNKSTRADVAREIEAHKDANAEMRARLVEADLQDIVKDPELRAFANNAGEAVFRNFCSQCHGRGGQGAQAAGYPNLLDDSWLWGGTIEDIYTTISVGVRYEETDEDYIRQGEMSAFGRDELLSKDEVQQVVAFVRKLSDQEHDADLAEAGAVVYEDNCSSCHMEDGTGEKSLGAPNLTDAIWLYGGDAETLYETIWSGRGGQMPARGGAPESVVDEANIRAVATYVHGLGGGVASE